MLDKSFDGPFCTLRGINYISISKLSVLVGHPEPEKKNSVGIFEYILASMLKVYLDVF